MKPASNAETCKISEIVIQLRFAVEYLWKDHFGNCEKAAGEMHSFIITQIPLTFVIAKMLPVLNLLIRESACKD